MIGVETNRDILGGQFLVTAQIDGQALPQHPSYQVAGLLHDLSPAGRHSLWSDAIRNIAKINRLDWQDGFTFLNRNAYGSAGASAIPWLAACLGRLKPATASPTPCWITRLPISIKNQPQTDRSRGALGRFQRRQYALHRGWPRRRGARLRSRRAWALARSISAGGFTWTTCSVSASPN